MSKVVVKSKLANRAKKIAELGIEQRPYMLSDALAIMLQYKQVCAAKFDESVDIVCRLGVDPKHSDQMVRGAVILPAGTGKKVRVAVFTSADKLKDMQKSGADVIGSDDLVASIKKGATIEFDKCICTPDYMPELAKSLGKILGPSGMMPNPKLGTVTDNVNEAVAALKGGQVEFKVDKEGAIHAGIGRLSFNAKGIEENVKVFISALMDAKPASAKGEYMKKVYLVSTMGPAIELDIKSLIA